MTASARLWRLAVGVFAGALASFFPRLVTVLSGSPTENVAVFSPTYLAVGAIVALVVGIAVTIIDDDPQRPMRDFFMTALGIPTLLMGALSTNATANNTALDQLKLRETSDQLARSTQIEVRPGADAPVPRTEPRPGGGISLLELVIPSAYAQTNASPQPNALGIRAVEPRYTTVLKEARSEAELRPLQQNLAQRGIQTQVVTRSAGNVQLLPAGPAKPYSDAVLSAVRAKELGASPYLVPAR